MFFYKATVEILVQCNTEAEACDAIAESLRDLTHSGDFADWQYAQKNGKFTAPAYLSDFDAMDQFEELPH